MANKKRSDSRCKEEGDDYSILNANASGRRGECTRLGEESNLHWKTIGNEPPEQFSPSDADSMLRESEVGWRAVKRKSAVPSRDETIRRSCIEENLSMVVNQSSGIDHSSKAQETQPEQVEVEKASEPRHADPTENGNRDNPLENLKLPLNISKQRYEAHMRQREADGRTGYAGSKESNPGCSEENMENSQRDLARHLEDTIKMHIQKESNMRTVIKTQENSLRIKDQEILLFQQKISAMEADMDVGGRSYIEECVSRGEMLTKTLSEELKSERELFQKQLGKEMENSRILLRKIDDLKKIINELVRKIKKQRA